MNTVTTSPPANALDGPAEEPRHDFHDAVVHQGHVMTTHFAVIEGWLGLLEDGTIDDAQRRRAACIVRERTEALRLDLDALLDLAKQFTGHPAGPTH